MSSNAAQFTGEIPKNYDEGLGPVIFNPYADDIAARAKALKPKNVLELAAGTGRVTRVLRNALPASTPIVATDLNDAMLDVARPLFRKGENISFEVVDAMSIPKDEGAFDLLLAQFGVMFMPDKAEHYREALRVLEPGGTYLFNAWDSWEGNPWAGLGHNMVETFFPGEAPGFYKVPFHYHDPDEIKKDLKAAGFENIKIERIARDGKITSWDTFAHAIVFGNPLADEIRGLGAGVAPEDVRDAVKEKLIDANGKAPTTIALAAYVVTAQKPGGKKKGFLAKLFGG